MAGIYGEMKFGYIHLQPLVLNGGQAPTWASRTAERVA